MITPARFHPSMSTEDLITALNYNFGQIEGESMSDINSDLRKSSYSFKESKTGNTWVDGKPIYRKVIDLGALPNNTSKNVAHGITNLDNIISMNTIVKGGTVNFVLPAARVVLSGQIGVFRDGANITVETNTNRTTFTGQVVLEYTKTS